MHCSTRDRCEMAPAGFPPLLAIDFESRTRATSDLPGAADAHSTIRDGERLWGARKVQAELEKLGFCVSLATVSRYLPKRRPTDAQRQRWTTFLRNHRDAIAAMDFLVVPTIRSKLLYVWFVIEHDRRRALELSDCRGLAVFIIATPGARRHD